MSSTYHNYIVDRNLSSEDDEYCLNIDSDIRNYLDNNCPDNSVLLFPPVSNYRRFLIHKVCETITANKKLSLATFSIGAGESRRTVVCARHQLLIDPKSFSLKSTDQAEYSWRYLERNSVLKPRRTKIMGVENCDVQTSQHIINDHETDSSAVDGNSSSPDAPLKSYSKKPSLSRTRRPDRAVYVPRAKRSQTLPPSSSSASLKSHCNKSEKSKSIDEHQLPTANIDESFELSDSSNGAVITSCDRLQLEKPLRSCDLIDQNHHQIVLNTDPSKDEKNQKNLNINTMNEQEPKALTIKSAGGIAIVTDKDDKDEKELIKASQEINRSNRKLIKQTFNSDVLEIAGKQEESNAVNKDDDDDWDTLFDDNGDCLDDKMVKELTNAVGKVRIEKPKSDYSAYQSKADILKDEEFPHVLECSNFPSEFRTQDIMMLFSGYKESGFEIKWVDDNHCLIVFSSAKVAAEVLAMPHSFVKMKPLAEATVESRSKAKKCSSSLQPYKQRPETCAALARRLVSGALGVRLKTATEERENEKRVLREAKERKKQAAKAREEMWND